MDDFTCLDVACN